VQADSLRYPRRPWPVQADSLRYPCRLWPVQADSLRYPRRPWPVQARAYQCSNKCPARPGLGLGVRRLPCVHQEHNGSLADE